MIFGVLLGSAATAQAEIEKIPDSLKSFFLEYVAISKLGDPKALRAMTHPEIVACISNTTESYHSKLEKHSQWQFSQIPNDASLGTDNHMERDLAAAKPFMFGTKYELNWKVVPDLRLYVTYSTGGQRGGAALYLSKTKNGWKRVYPCQFIAK